MLKNLVSYKSSNGTDDICAYIYSDENIVPKAILQISHGMCEYIGRYEEFIEYMVNHGYVVCGNDHLGHGETSTLNGMDGFFAPENGDKHVLNDMHEMTNIIKGKYPNLPVCLLGHSMGSFFARKYASEFKNDIDSLIISGTGGPNPLLGIGIKLSTLIGKVKGNTYRSKLIDKMVFGSYCSKIPGAANQYAWVTNDPLLLEKYVQDPKCMFKFTVKAFYDMLVVNRSVNSDNWAHTLRKDMPIYVFSGEMDPVGDYGKSVKTVYNNIKKAGVQDVTLKLYEGGLHEMLNSTIRPKVYEDVLNWLDSHI